MHATRSLALAHPNSALARSREVAQRTIETCVSQVLSGGSASFAERERMVLHVTNEVGRRVLEADLQRMADDYPEEVSVGGVRATGDTNPAWSPTTR